MASASLLSARRQESYASDAAGRGDGAGGGAGGEGMGEGAPRWDAAVKRAFRLPAMLASMENKSEAGVAKRLRMAGALNQQGRLLYFYGLGICLASNHADHDEFKFEAVRRLALSSEP